MIDRVEQCCMIPKGSCKGVALCWIFTELESTYQSPRIRLIRHAKDFHQLEPTSESELHDDPNLKIAGIARRKEFPLNIADYIHKMPTTGQHKTQHIGDISNQRASKACNRCRAKKSRCSGGYPCSKCKSSDAPCIFGYSKVSKRRIFPEHYVRTLETQQFKLVAGLQTMYFMLLATNSWPGKRLPERKGNPLVHDLLDRLDLLEPGTEEQITMDVDENEDESDTSQDVTSPASTIRSSERLQNDIHNGTESRSEDFSTLSPCSTLQQQLCSDGGANRLTAQPWQYQPQPLLSLPLPLSTDFVLKPPSKMTAFLSDVSTPTQSVGATSWSVTECPEVWWQRKSHTIQDISSSSSGFASGAPGVDSTANTSSLEILAAHVPDLYLRDSGAHLCDFD